HQIPDLDVAVAVLLGRSRRAAPDFGAVVVEDFGTGAAGAGIGHLPEIIRGIARTLVVADTDDALPRYADFLRPDVVGLVVFLVDRDPQLFLGQAVDFGQQGPGIGDGIALEIIAEAEVAQHFEERMVPGGIADVFQVVVLAPRAHAALCGRCPAVGPGVLAGEDVLELDHAGVGEEQRRVIARHQRRRRHDLVPFRLEKGQEFLTDLGGFHSFGRWGKLAGHYIRFDTTNRASSRKHPAGPAHPDIAGRHGRRHSPPARNRPASGNAAYNASMAG